MVFPIIRRAGRVAVVLLLAWTALDLINPALCGLDALPSVGGVAELTSDIPTPTAPRIPAEDCFCCSHNVNFRPIARVAVSVLSDGEARPYVVRSPLWTSVPLYHPPRFLA